MGGWSEEDEGPCQPEGRFQGVFPRSGPPDHDRSKRNNDNRAGLSGRACDHRGQCEEGIVEAPVSPVLKRAAPEPFSRVEEWEIPCKHDRYGEHDPRGLHATGEDGQEGDGEQFSEKGEGQCRSGSRFPARIEGIQGQEEEQDG